MTACILSCTPYRLGLYGVISVDNLDNTNECDKWAMQSGYGAEIVSGFFWYSTTLGAIRCLQYKHIKGWDLNKHINPQLNLRLKNEKCHFISVHPGKKID